MRSDVPDSHATSPIGIAMSGGGYRAAAFHLGSLAYLYRVGLGTAVQQISTVSGGTFIGASYALWMVEQSRRSEQERGDRPFDAFFREFYHQLADIDLVKRGLALLGGLRPETPSGRHDLIVAMAQVYAETFMQAPGGKPYLFGELLDADIQLREAVFNTTEFRHGNAFRFQRSSSSKALIGNRLLNIGRDAAAKIRMADIVAASSCFPGGFEPFAFPFDFTWPGGAVPDELHRQFTRDGKPFPVGLMDGGIYDNQGVESLLYADRRDAGDLGIFVISDVDQKSDDLFPFPVGQKVDGGPTLGRLAFYTLLLLLLCIGSVAVVGYRMVQAIRTEGIGWVDVLLYVIPIALVGMVGYVLYRIRSTVRDVVLPMIPQVGRYAWRDLRKLRLHQILFMVRLRIGSLLALTSSVFMKRIRGLVYGIVYSDTKYSNKRISNLIYELASDGPGWPRALPADVPQTSPTLHRVADIAADTPTTLWFDDDKPYQQPCLVATGQATICFNLMKWIARNHGEDPSSYPPRLRSLWQGLLADWRQLNAEPYALLQELLPGEKLVPPT